MSKKYLFILLIIGGSVLSLLNAQDFRWEWEIEAPQEAGFHRIQLPVYVNCVCKPDLADLRLYAVGESTEVPFLLERSAKEVTTLYPEELIIEDNSELKFSLVKMSLDCQAPLHEMVVKVASPAKFYRQAQLTEVNRSKEGVSLLAETWLDGAENSVPLAKRAYNSELTLKVFNEDNQPLQIDTIAFKMDSYQILAELDPEKEYVLRFGNTHKSPPQYDLRFYRDEIEVLDQVLEVKGVATSLLEVTPQPTVVEEIEAPAEEEWYQNPLVIWGVLGLIVGLLGIMTWRMLKKE